MQVLEFIRNCGRCTVLHRAMTTWNYIPHQVNDASSRIRFFFKYENTPFGPAGTVKRHTQVQTHICTQTLAHALYTHVHCNIVVWWYYTPDMYNAECNYDVLFYHVSAFMFLYPRQSSCCIGMN